MRSRRPGESTNSQRLIPSAEGDQGRSNPIESDPFFFLKFEPKPLDDRADNAITLNMRHMEIVYHPNYLEDVTKFFRPPASQLESVGALIDVASSTLEGIRQDTRAVLEFALQTHKTVDIKVDMNAPTIIIPQDVTRHDCHHIILDVGHIAVSTKLMSQDRLETIKAKQNRQHTNDDYAQLESMMYDQFHVELTDTQLLLDKSFEKCLVALDEPRGHEEAHLIERISMNFNVFNCMVDNAPNLTRFKVQGNLPELRVNFSDRKYNIVMSMIDIALPNFCDESEAKKASEDDKQKETALKPPHNQNKLSRKPKKQPSRIPAFFSNEASLAYDLSDDERPPSHVREVTNPGEDDEFFGAPDLSQAEQSVNFRQNNFQLQFTVRKPIVAISKTDANCGEEQRLVDSVLEGFYFGLSLRNFDLVVEITLSSMYIADQKKDLVKFKYTQVQNDHPEYMTLYEGIGKSVDSDLSTINIVGTRPTILEFFDWIMNTFTDTDSSPSPSDGTPNSNRQPPALDQSGSDLTLDKIRVKVRMRTIAFLFNDDGCRLAILALSSADFSVLLNGPTMRVNARLGNLTIEDDTVESNDTKFRRLVEIQGDDLANFQYETFLKGDSTYPGHDSMICTIAQLRANKPTIPLDSSSSDSLIAYLGEINASNPFSGSGDELLTATKAGLHNIRLTSELSNEGKPETLEILGDVNIDLIIATFNSLERFRGSSQSPDSDIAAHMSDVKISLTQPQYFALLALVSSIPKILDLSELNQNSPRHQSASHLDSHVSHLNSKSQISKPRLLQQNSQVSSTSNQHATDVWITMELGFSYPLSGGAFKVIAGGGDLSASVSSTLVSGVSASNVPPSAAAQNGSGLGAAEHPGQASALVKMSPLQARIPPSHRPIIILEMDPNERAEIKLRDYDFECNWGI
ncbi:hypothetical protein PtB15_11B218 [Puccinia triticina]|nr:hypothetical protein PtB15_11B218 [Puccinia triticina]